MAITSDLVGASHRLARTCADCVPQARPYARIGLSQPPPIRHRSQLVRARIEFRGLREPRCDWLAAVVKMDFSDCIGQVRDQFAISGTRQHNRLICQARRSLLRCL